MNPISLRLDTVVDSLRVLSDYLHGLLGQIRVRYFRKILGTVLSNFPGLDIARNQVESWILERVK